MNFSSDLVLKLQEELRASRAHVHKLLKRNAELEIVTDNTQVILNLEKKVAELEAHNLGLTKTLVELEQEREIRDLEQQAKGVQRYVKQVAETVHNYPWYLSAPPTLEELYEIGFGLGSSQNAILHSEKLLEQADQLKAVMYE